MKLPVTGSGTPKGMSPEVMDMAFDMHYDRLDILVDHLLKMEDKLQAVEFLSQFNDKIDETRALLDKLDTLRQTLIVGALDL